MIQTIQSTFSKRCKDVQKKKEVGKVFQGIKVFMRG